MIRRTAVLSIFGIFAVSALLLPGCSNLAEPAEERSNFRGEITQLKTEGLQHQRALAEIIIEEDPSFPLEEWLKNPGSDGSQKYRYSVLPGTRIYRQTGDESPVEIGLEALTVGSIVRAWDTGFIVKTLLPLAYAEKIILVSPAP
ncbi:MAG: hypothetical protein H0X65_13285 [Gemmatimonadetes bacterium]|nr:hypothetical protein [Gemmatimonadota bacterium]